MPGFTGVSHVVLTVRDVKASAEWYRTLFELQTIDEHPNFALLLHPGSRLMFAFIRHERSDGRPFDETRVGLDHLALQVSGRAELEAWTRKLESLRVMHSPIATPDYGQVLVFRDPDNIQLEFFAAPGA